jgi:5-methylcytosine-specific restriction endonuclease McrA
MDTEIMSRKDLEISDTRARVYCRDGFQCQYPRCGQIGYTNLEMAHRISKGKGNVFYVMNFWWHNYAEWITAEYAKKILNHDMNLVSSCSKHNSYFNIGNQPVERDKLLREIKKALT